MEVSRLKRISTDFAQRRGRRDEGKLTYVRHINELESTVFGHGLHVAGRRRRARERFRMVSRSCSGLGLRI